MQVLAGMRTLTSSISDNYSNTPELKVILNGYAAYKNSNKLS